MSTKTFHHWKKGRHNLCLFWIYVIYLWNLIYIDSSDGTFVPGKQIWTVAHLKTLWRVIFLYKSVQNWYTARTIHLKNCQVRNYLWIPIQQTMCLSLNINSFLYFQYAYMHKCRATDNSILKLMYISYIHKFMYIYQEEKQKTKTTSLKDKSLLLLLEILLPDSITGNI